MADVIEMLVEGMPPARIEKIDGLLSAGGRLSLAVTTDAKGRRRVGLIAIEPDRTRFTLLSLTAIAKRRQPCTRWRRHNSEHTVFGGGLRWVRAR